MLKYFNILFYCVPSSMENNLGFWESGDYFLIFALSSPFIDDNLFNKKNSNLKKTEVFFFAVLLRHLSTKYIVRNNKAIRPAVTQKYFIKEPPLFS